MDTYMHWFKMDPHCENKFLVGISGNLQSQEQ